jgi:hypothetical protein
VKNNFFLQAIRFLQDRFETMVNDTSHPTCRQASAFQRNLPPAGSSSRP